MNYFGMEWERSVGHFQLTDLYKKWNEKYKKSWHTLPEYKVEENQVFVEMKGEVLFEEFILYDGFVEWIPYDENMNVIEFIAVETTKVGFRVDVAIENEERAVTALVVVIRGTKIRQY